jgi:hypothetical protein
MDEQAPAIARPKAFRITATVFGLIFGLAFFGFPGLILGWFEGGDRLIHRVHDLSTGVLTGLLFAVPLLALAVRKRVAPLHQVAVATVAGITGAAMSVDPVWLVFLVPGVVGVVALLAIGGPALRRAFLAPERRPSPSLAVIPLAAAVPLTMFAWSMAKLQRAGVAGDSHVDEHHWATMASMAIALWLVGLLASLRMPGWLVPARCAGLGAVIFGVASLVFPDSAGSVGKTWGLELILGGAVYLGLAQLEARRPVEAARSA